MIFYKPIPVIPIYCMLITYVYALKKLHKPKIVCCKFYYSYRFISYRTYCGLIMNSDIKKKLNIFYKHFNWIIQKFAYCNVNLKLKLFHSYWIEFWTNLLYRLKEGLKRFATEYHKAIKSFCQCLTKSLTTLSVK